MKVTNVYKTVGDTDILQDVSLSLVKGKVTAFIGPNGAGKSTLLAIMSRLLKKDSGTVTVNGKEIESWKTEELAKELSILKQQNVYQVRMTVRELLSFGRFPYSKGRLNPEDHEIIERVLGYLQMREYGNRYLDTLSGGQLQRAAIAMILVQDTDFILLDEPLNSLDLKQGIIAMETIRQLADDLGKTILVVLHDINFASAYADQVIAMKEGRIHSAGPVEEVFRKEILQDVFGIELDVQTINGKRYCLYHTN